MSIAGILVALAALIYLAYRGVSVLVLSPLVAALAVLFAWGTQLLASYTQVFMPAPGLGIIAGLIMFGFGIGWLALRARRATQAGEGYQPRHGSVVQPSMKELREHAQGEGFDLMEIPESSASEALAMPFGLALTPIVLVIAFNYVFSALVFPAVDTGYLAQPLYGATSVASVKGVWAIICALLFALLFLVVVSPQLRASLKRSVDDGANAAVLPIFNTASLVGFGAVIASLPGFALIRDGVLGLAPDNPLISLSIAVNVLAGITGSASGGMSIALETLGDTYLALGQAAGISPELMHRVTAIATGGLDALPHNGAVITLLSICRLTHRDAYLDIFMVAAAGPILSLVAVVVLGSTIGTF